MTEKSAHNKLTDKTARPNGVLPPAVEPENPAVTELQEKVQALSRTNRQLKRKIFDLYTIFEISRNFNAVLHYESLLDSFIFTCLGQVGALKGSIFLKKEFDATTYCSVRSKGSGDLPRPEQFFREDSALLRHLVRLNRPVLTAEITADNANPNEMEIVSMFRGGMLVPLIFQSRLVGLFILAEKISEQEFVSDDVEFLSVLGNQISVSIENARLYEAERQALVQLREAQGQLLQSERLAALGEMSAKIAHEVNNPLGIIKNYLQLVRRAGGENNEVADYTKIVSQEIDRIAAIVAQMREFQRPTSMQLEPVDLPRVADEIVTLIGRQMKSSRIEIIREYAEGPLVVMGSSDGLKQVLLNLAINARTAMTDGGILKIILEPVEDKIRISIQDNGPGIPSEIVSRIFEPFFTTRGDQGTGLGLSVCYGIVRSHRGTISFTNLNPGGCFDILLPRAHGQEIHGVNE